MRLLQKLSDWFQNLSLKNKLTVIIVEMAVFLVFIGFVGFYVSYKENQNLLLQYQNRLLSIKWTNSIWANLSENEASVYKLALMSDPLLKRQLAEEIVNRGKIWQSELNDYSNIALHDSYEEVVIPSLKERASRYRMIRDKSVKLALSGDHQRFWESYSAYLPLLDSIRTTLKDLSEYNDKMAAKEYAVSLHQFMVSYFIVIISILFALFLAVFLGTLMVSSITKSTQILIDKMKQVASGNLDVDLIDVKYSDEIGNLSELFNIMTDNLRRTTLKGKISREREDFLRKEVEEQRKNFLSTLTHDLRSPILAEQKAIEAILDKRVGESLADISEYLKEIYKTNEALLRIVNNMLISDYYEEGTIELELAPKNIKEIINNSIKSIKPLADDNDSEIILDIQSDLPLVNVNSDEISRVMINLVTNALKHNTKGTNIKVSAKKLDSGVRVAISDNGKGIPAVEIPNIFRKYPSIKRKVGSGLGLYLSKQIIDAHNGRIWFETQEGKGTTFYFLLPID